MNAQRNLLLPIAISLAALALIGCGESLRTSAPVARTLPVEPGFAQRVPVAHTASEDPLLAAGRERAGRAKANDIITCFVTWYRQVRADYGAEQAEQLAGATLKNCEEK